MSNGLEGEGPSHDKLRNLILYVSDVSETDEKFGLTKLNKILFYADFAAYVCLGESITGEIYQHLPHGPAPRRMRPTLDNMQANQDIVVKPCNYFDHDLQKPLALRQPVLRDFSGEQIAIVDGVLRTLRDKNASDVSEMSHRFDGWKLTAVGEDIPYFTALLFSEDEIPEIEQWESVHLENLGSRMAAAAR